MIQEKYGGYNVSIIGSTVFDSKRYSRNKDNEFITFKGIVFGKEFWQKSIDNSELLSDEECINIINERLVRFCRQYEFPDCPYIPTPFLEWEKVIK